jgi:addiction module HigA family antidote
MEEAVGGDSPWRIPFEEFMKPLGLSINRLARDLHVPPTRIHAIIHGSRSITAETDLRLAAYFETAPETWIKLQADYDQRVARRTMGAEILRTVRKREAA